MARLRLLWTRVRDSLWFLPGVLTLTGAVLAITVTQAEAGGVFDVEMLRSWVFGGGVDGARGVLGTIAGGLITVTGVVFSVTIVALQLASSQFTPRVLRNFTADRGNQLVLGVFIGTFTYTLLVLRTIRSASDGENPFVPRVGVTLAVVFVLVAIGFLIFYINHSARSIQVAAILDRVAHRTLRDVRRLFPEQVGHADVSRPPDPRPAERPSVTVTADGAGYLQAVDGRRLFELGRGRRLVIAMEPHVGDFILPGQPLATVSPPDEVDDAVRAAVRGTFLLGPERTPEQDVEFGIVEISDIALKALSPGINDPTTAFRCIDRLAEVLLELGRRDPPSPWRTERGEVHYLARHPTFERAVGLAFDQVRHFGASNPGIARKLLDVLARLAELVPASRRPVLLAQARVVAADADARMATAADRAAVAETARRLAPHPDP
ncbi:DUF2254 domain-containing protein [Longimicrobium sp.]|uniref:DUF2254 domain-containing protein n=1 Tax=Longimicrobium sp. TaxID=2029185 RepID=UPI002E337EBD|nr:DUF2254 domain-containing protein [Longimicrobium sp.]HEX6038247.1 DUF2254 domain-containing protein [Longimicrobium sp.]